jgi:D-glycero-alpha-D-manno-heptose-7-phosphate kinase
MIITRTPFRISFFGGGTDYPVWYGENGGAVLSTSIDKYCYIICRDFPPFFEHNLRVVWSKIELANHPDEIEHPTARETLKHLGIHNGVEIHHHGDLPARSGLGSSSSFTVGLLHGLQALQGKMATKRQLAFDAIHIERERVGHNIGSQDQVAAAFGGLNKIVFGGPAEIDVRPVVLPRERQTALEDRLMLFFTGLARTASDVLPEQMKNTPAREKELRAMHDLVDQALTVLHSDRDLADFGRMLHETWQLKKTLSSAITTSRIDEIYDAARSAGAVGGKLLGAGSGGFMLFYVEPELQAKVREKLNDLLYVPFRFDSTGSQVIYYGPNQMPVAEKGMPFAPTPKKISPNA